LLSVASCLLPLACCLFSLPGCAVWDGLTAAQQHEEAERNWAAVRAKVKYQLAAKQFDAGRIDAAAISAREALGLDPTLADAHVLLCRALLEKGDLAGARAVLTAAEAAGIRTPETLYMLGVIAERSEDSAQALRYYTEARSLDPGDPDYLVAQAECLVALGRPEEAAQLVTAALDGSEPRPPALDVPMESGGQGSGRAELSSTDRPTRGSATADLEVSLYPDAGREAGRRPGREPPGPLRKLDNDGTIDALLGNILLVMGDDPGALAAFRRAMPLLSRQDLFCEQYGLLLFRMGYLAEALSVLGPLHDRQGAEAAGPVVRALAQCNLELGRLDAAGDVLSPWLRDHPGDAAAWLLQAGVALRRDDPAAAQHDADTARRLAPGQVSAHLVYACASRRLAEPDEALTSLQRCLQLDPDNVWAHCLLAQVLSDAQRLEEADEHWRRALQIDPHCEPARRALERSSTLDVPVKGSSSEL